MSSFSQRMGIKPVHEVLQIESMDESLRTRLWNAIAVHYFPRPQVTKRLDDDKRLFVLAHALWSDVLNRPIDVLPAAWEEAQRLFRAYFFECPWYSAYDMVEYIASKQEMPGRKEEFIPYCNDVLRLEASVYRFVGGKLLRITSESEIVAIQDALAVTAATVPLHTVNEHFSQALTLLADRQTPDYRNSMKESISAVEAICKLIAGDSSTTLGRALDMIEQQGKVALHGSLKRAFQALYGYTNDSSGIRHALKDEPNVEFEDATYMLVTCSAFVNYLVEKARKAGIAL